MPNRIVFNGDAGNYVREVQKATTETRAMQREISAAKKEITDTYQRARLEAKAFGASTEELRKLDQAYARDLLALKQTREDVGRATVVSAGKEISAEEAKANALVQVRDRLKEVNAELAKRPVVDHEVEITRRQQASAILRGGGLRAAESFATTLPGFDKFAGAAFPILGGVALAKDLADIVGKFIEMRDKAREATEVIREGFRSIEQPIQLTGDELRKRNAELDITIAKLEKKPANTLALALAEDALAADHLAERADNAYNAIKKLLDENQNGAFSQIFFNKGATGAVYDDVRRYAKDYRDEQRKLADLQHGNAPQGVIASQQGKVKAAAAAAIEYADSKSKELNGSVTLPEMDNQGFITGYKTQSYADMHGSQGENLAALDGLKRTIQGSQDLEGLYAANTEKQATVKRLQSEKGLSGGGKSRAETDKAAFEAQKQQWDSEHIAWLAQTQRSHDDELHFWDDRANTVKNGSLAYAFAVDQSNKALAKVHTDELKALYEKLAFARSNRLEQIKSASEVLERANGSQDKDIRSQQSSLRAMHEAREGAGYKVALSSVQEQLRTGAISRSDAAVQTQTLHTLQYAAALKRLQEQRQAVTLDTSLSSYQRDAELNNLGKEGIELDANRAIQEYQDVAAVAGQSIAGALKQANAEWVQDSQDVAHKVAGIYTGALNGVNGDLTGFLENVGSKQHRHAGRELRDALGDTARGIGGQFADMGLRYAESSILGKFGFGAKADGSKSNPFYTISADLTGTGSGNGSALSSGLFSRIASGFGNDTDTGTSGGSSAGNTVAGLISTVAQFGGFFAEGGAMTPGKSYIVGEAGPELFTPGASGFVTPNHALSTAAGGTHHWNVAVDARGAGNPAEVEAAAHRAVMAAAPHIVNASLQAHKDLQSRMPSSKR